MGTSVITVTLVTAPGIPEGAQPRPGMASGGIAPLHPWWNEATKHVLDKSNHGAHRVGRGIGVIVSTKMGQREENVSMG